MIKQGEWVRVKDVEFTNKGWINKGVKIVKIKEINDDYSPACINYSTGAIRQSDIIGNSKPTPVELLEVGDIVHYVDILDRKDEDVTIIKNEEMLKKFKNWFALNPKEITAIELHENRVIQRLEENNGN